MGARPPMRQDLGRASGVGRVDPEVIAQLEAGTRRQRKAKRGPRSKATFDIPVKVLDALRAVARAEDVALGDLVALALIDLIEDHRAGKLDLSSFKFHAHSLRVGFRLELPEEWR